MILLLAEGGFVINVYSNRRGEKKMHGVKLQAISLIYGHLWKRQRSKQRKKSEVEGRTDRDRYRSNQNRNTETDVNTPVCVS